jgi:hypothetical protein
MEGDDENTQETSTSSAVTRLRTPHSIRKRCTGLPEEQEQSTKELKVEQGEEPSPTVIHFDDTSTLHSVASPPSTGNAGPNGSISAVEGTNPIEAVAVQTSQEVKQTEGGTDAGPPKKAYSAFSKNQRWMIVIISSIAGIFR